MEIKQSQPPAPAPQITVLVPTHGRPDRIDVLIGNLKRQTVSPESYEVIVVDDGGDPAVQLDVRELPFACTVLQRRNRGPAAARNAGLALASAPLVLILNDDAVPADDLIERHLAAHQTCGPRTAVLGTFHFTEASRQSPFVRVLDATERLFAFTSLRHGERYNWQYFWTCNISLTMDALLEVGGFDEETFDRAICEDVELGLRLERLGHSVLYDETCVAHHEHRLSPSSYRARAVQLGIYQSRTQRKHGALAPLTTALSLDPIVCAQQCLRTTEGKLAESDELFARLEEDEQRYEGKALPEGYIAKTDAELSLGVIPYWTAGIYEDLTGIDPIEHIREGAPAGTSVAVIVVSCDARAHTQRCIESLRAARSERYPLTMIVIDNGSTDGSVEWLETQKDLTVVLNPSNLGAPRARNQGLAHVPEGTDWIVFMDNDVFVPLGWLERALYHGAVDPQVGSVALCANRASKLQVTPYPGTDSADDINEFADAHAAAHFRQGEDTTLFTSLAVLVRKTAMDAIGGLDETFSPWGFEDDDLALRIRLSGYRNRVARDTFVYHAAYDGPAKNERHQRWLVQNWEAFLRKWSPRALGSPLFDYDRVTLPQLGEATKAQLYFPLPDAGASAPTWPGQEASEATTTPDMDALTEPKKDTLLPHATLSSASADQAAGERASVLVMGCGRSGTSMVTGMLADAGWYVGDEPYAGRSANPKGFFETAEINGINEFLLSNAVPNEPPLRRMQHWLAFAPQVIDFEVDDSLRNRMNRLAARRPFAFKDPRFCYTLPAWRPSLEGARYVCIFREPSASAASIVKEIGDAPYLDGVGVDFDRAIDIWQAMYRQVLDDHSQTGEWLFLHFDQLFTPRGVARLEDFVGGPVAADFPEARLKRSSSNTPVSAEVAETFRELCQRAEFQAPPIAATPALPTTTEVENPELTVLICSYQRRDTLLRCLTSFENQTAVGRYEIVVVNDGSNDGTREALDQWTPRAPLNVIHRENGGLAAARNTGLAAARGKYVLLVNDDTIADPELVEEHLAAHEEHGPHRAVLGTFEQPREALDNALMRVIEESDLVFCYHQLDPDKLHDWSRFWTCNVSVSLDDVRQVGLFDEAFRHYGCEDTDLGYRLQRECGTRVVFAPRARATHEHILTFEDLKRRSHTVASAFVRFFEKHPEARLHPDWRTRAERSTALKEEIIVKTLPERSRAEALARELSDINVGVIERAGPEGVEIARAITTRLEEYLGELNFLWWLEGEIQAEAEGVGRETTLATAKAPTMVAC